MEGIEEGPFDGNDGDDDAPPRQSKLQRGVLLKEAGYLQGSEVRCVQCNSAIVKDTVLCPECFHPTQADLTPEEAAFVRQVATADPDALYGAIEKAKAAAAAAADDDGSDTEVDSESPDPQGPKMAATHVAGVRFDISRSNEKQRSRHAGLSGLWFKYYERSKKIYRKKYGDLHSDPKFDYLGWRWEDDHQWRARMEATSRIGDRRLPDVNPQSIEDFNRGDMRCCFPDDVKWHGKAMRQPHSGVPVPKRIVEEVTQVLSVSGGGVTTQIQHPARKTWGEALKDHRLVLGERPSGKRAYVDAHPMAASPAVQQDDPRGSWRSRSSSAAPYQGPRPSQRPNAQHGRATHPSAPGAASSSGGAAQAAPKRPPPRREVTCSACHSRQPMSDIPGYCVVCRGHPWQCTRWNAQRNAYCQHWNFPWATYCAACFPFETFNTATGRWEPSKRRHVR